MSSKPLEAGDAIGRERFCRACGQFATGIVVAAALDPEGRPHGMTANSFTSVSLDPPLVLFCIDHRARVLPTFKDCKYFAINVLAEDQRALSTHFARPAGDRFTGVEWQPGRTGAPVLPGALAVLECALHRTEDWGDHTVVVGEVLDCQARPGKPLLYFASQYSGLRD